MIRGKPLCAASRACCCSRVSSMVSSSSASYQAKERDRKALACENKKPAGAAANAAAPAGSSSLVLRLLVEHELLRINQRPQEVLVSQASVLHVRLDVVQGHLQVLGARPPAQRPQEQL